MNGECDQSQEVLVSGLLATRQPFVNQTPSMVRQRRQSARSSNPEATITAAVRKKARAGRALSPSPPSVSAERSAATARRALKADPEDPHALHVLGLIARDRGRHERAVQLLEKAAAAAPDAADIVCDLGLALKAAGRLDEAIAAHRRVVELLPDVPRAWSNLGTTLTAAKRHDEAIAAFLHAISFDSHEPELHYNLGNALLDAGDPATAESAFTHALARAPNHVGALTNLGCALKDQGRLAEADAVLRGAIALAPDNADLKWNLALALLAAGGYEEGWSYYEARRAIPGFSIRPQRIPPWDGRPLRGRRLLVHAEQGFGDTLQFCRYLLPLKEAGADVVFEAPARLHPLLRSLPFDIALTAPGDKLPRCDVHAPLMSLPHLLGPATPLWPASGPYISTEPARVARWADRLAGHAGLTVAIGWQGNPDYRNDATRSVPLAAFSPLANLPGVRLVSLQQGYGAAQIADQPWRDKLLHLGEEIDGDGAFLDSAAILYNVDLVITSDTALAHLAGAMGAPVWLALSHVPDWRWGLAGERCPWYPTMRLFRQPARGGWRPVFYAMARTVAELPA